MSPRSIRRAAERKARKLAQKRSLPAPPQTEDQPRSEDRLDAANEPPVKQPPFAPASASVEAARSTPTGITISLARLAANRSNAQLSSGPTSAPGKAKSSLNALKTGLTGRTILLPSDDVEAYQVHLARFEAQWKPATEPERALVHSIADTEWRLLRIPCLESGIYALGRLEFAGLFEDHDESARPALIDAKILLAYQRQLNNLGIQENRLRRYLDKDLALLQQMQSEREQTKRDLVEQRAKALNQAALAFETARNEGAPFNPAAFGFEFSIEELDQRLSIILDARERRRELHELADAQHAAFRAEAIAKVRRESKAA